MLNSLHIKNYKNLRDVSFPTLKRVNLITGKNNTGKSSLLEAISIYVNEGNLSQLYQILKHRGETSDLSRAKPEDIFRAFYSFFYDRPSSPAKEYEAIFTGGLSKTNLLRSVSLGTKFYIYDPDEKRRIGLSESDPIRFRGGAFSTGIKIEIENNSTIYSIDELPEKIRFSSLEKNDNFHFIKNIDFNRDLNSTLWDTIALSDKEEEVVNFLKIIQPNIEKLTFAKNDYTQIREARVKLTSGGIIPLRIMGDGINRILTMSLALVDCDDGFLLIDEFENGLHHSIQEKLWEIIFELSKALNVQVFATTHSYDCVRAFEKIVNDKFKDEGALIKLENINGNITSVEFDTNELKIASEHEIELR